MKKMRKICSLALAAAMTFSLVACNKESSSGSSGTAGNSSAGTSTSQGGDAQVEIPDSLTLIVPYAAGGAVDLGSRLMAKYAANYTDVDIVITNVTGGGGTVARLN